ncbi:MAG: hypothetical protein R6W77_00025, partial [Trueperaceae bacterium]
MARPPEPTVSDRREKASADDHSGAGRPASSASSPASVGASPASAFAAPPAAAFDVASAAAALAALGHEARLEIYRALMRAGRRGLAVHEVQERLGGMPRST